jgi:trehalose/maltose hydrolase-like predicted phosphorylase
MNTMNPWMTMRTPMSWRNGTWNGAADTVDWLRSRHPEVWPLISERLQITPDEPASWRRTAERMTTGFDRETNLFEQFTGFFDLDDVDLAAYPARPVPLDVILGRDRTQKSKVVKQADVVALSALLWERFPLCRA